MAMTDRQPNGTFAPGHPGGPGRPPRAVEMVFLAKLADLVTLDDWQSIVVRAVADAKNGDAQARRWLSGFLLGDKGHLLSLAARESLGRTPADEVDALADDLASGEDLQ